MQDAVLVVAVKVSLPLTAATESKAQMIVIVNFVVSLSFQASTLHMTPLQHRSGRRDYF